MKAKHPITCYKCGVVDQTRIVQGSLVIGTDKNMRCSDCGGADGKATLCRLCCPTQHRTKL